MSASITNSVGPLNPTERAACELFEAIPPDRAVQLLVFSLTKTGKALAKKSALALLTTRGDQEKPLIERRSGSSLSTAQAALRLGKSAETIRAYVSSGTLIAYPDLTERSRIRLPEWQFAGSKETHVWVPQLIAAFGSNGWALLDFLCAPRTGQVAGKTFKGESLLDHIRAGDPELALEAAQRANPE